MPAKRYKVTLTQEEMAYLSVLVKNGKAAAKKLTHARILLNADQSEGKTAWPDQKISEALQVSCATIERVRKAFVEEGMEASLNRKKYSCCAHNKKFDGEKEAHLIALACSSPPPGKLRWTTQLLADKMVELNHFESLSDEAVRRVLKKTNLNLG